MTKESTTSTLGDESADQKADAAAVEHVANTTTAAGKRGKAASAAAGAAGDGAEGDGLDKALIAQGFSGKRVTVTIAPTRENSDQDFVFVSVNGIAFQIPRGKPFPVPEEVLEALENATEIRYNNDGVGREVTRHQFNSRA